MFDPTAFDNMKVVIEGALYDLDLAGSIVIVDRDDVVNLAKMSRSFDVHFTLSEVRNEQITAKIEILSTMKNLAAELLTDVPTEKYAGCELRLQFTCNGIMDEIQRKKLQKIFQDIWGRKRKIIQSVHITPSESNVLNIINVLFDRLISEEQMEDFDDLLDSMVTTLIQILTLSKEIHKNH